ncbi:MAG: PQQ-binding-like beta-propeller repeat protein, partial [Pirellulales bacterium]
MTCASAGWIGRTLAGAVLAAWLLLALQLDAPAEEWPRWRGPRGDGTWQGPKLPETWPAEGLRVSWRQALGGGYAGVSVAGGRVFVMDRQQQPQEVERVLCFDAATGQPLWRDEYKVRYGELDYGSGPRAAPTVFEGRVYTLGAVGHVRCLDAAEGSIVWSHDCVEEFNARIPEWGFAASPLIHEGLVIVHVAAEPGGCLMAFDRNDGREVWRSSSDPAGYATPIIVDRAGGPQLVAWTPEHVLGLSPRTGQIEWSLPYKVTYGVS